ncbi:cell wall hydrolase [Paracoccus liaowanqingii]|uniref:Cell wall hydrolase n=1 Tax=Paracoccus liaowanqingii TaxID=2560053 RepID=A0A4Z1CAQ3_9RHOB|nr:cell wall hydrolase [Paracoccus liaowanqingii]TGN60964.1 cell wall hydrolase [Paracoccus liaowanqingii]
MPKLLHRLAHVTLCAAIAVPLTSTIATAGGNGSLFSSDAVLLGTLQAAATHARPTPLLYTGAEPAKVEISPDAPIEQLHLASTRASYSGADLECMAEALYHEARGEGRQGQAAVAEVILNRVDSGAFPGTVCGVINQPSQFSYTIGGAKPIRNKGAYLRARDIAQAALSGAPRALTGGATYFHTPAVRPAWSHRFQRTVQIGRHIFYRGNQRVASN